MIKKIYLDANMKCNKLLNEEKNEAVRTERTDAPASKPESVTLNISMKRKLYKVNPWRSWDGREAKCTGLINQRASRSRGFENPSGFPLPAPKYDLWFLTGDKEIIDKCKPVYSKIISYIELRRSIDVA